MKVVANEQVLHEVFSVLVEHLEPWKVAQFWALCKFGEGDYLKTKDNLFANETFESLIEKIQAFETAENPRELL